MTAVGEIRAAIEKLTKLRDKSSQGWWTILDNGDRFIAEEDPDGDGPFEYIITEPVVFSNPVDADLIVTLHRTIDAQLDILRLDSAFFGAGITGPESATAFSETALSLARVINGPTS